MCVPSSFPLIYNATSLEKILLVVEYTHIYFDIYIKIIYIKIYIKRYYIYIILLSYKTQKDYLGNSLRI